MILGIIHIVDRISLQRHLADDGFEKTNTAGDLLYPGGDLLLVMNIITHCMRIVCIVVFVIFSIINMVNAAKKYRENNLPVLGKYTKAIKTGLIPFWIIHFVHSISVLYIEPLFGVEHFIVLLAAAYIVLTVSSVFSITWLRLLLHNNEITKKNFVVLVIMQLCFVTDFIGIMFLLKKPGKK
jgi:hypothetical protein